MHKLIINNVELELIGQEDYQVDNLLFLEFTTILGLEEVNTLFSSSDNLLEIKVVLDEAERLYKNFCVYKQLQFTNGDVPIYRIMLEQNDHLASALAQITDLQMAMVDMFELMGGE